MVQVHPSPGDMIFFRHIFLLFTAMFARFLLTIYRSVRQILWKTRIFRTPCQFHFKVNWEAKLMIQGKILAQ
jgi:hypothetical protein